VALATFMATAQGFWKEREYFCTVDESILEATRILVRTELPFLMSSNVVTVKIRALRNIGQDGFSYSEN
jgi:hypothetical protein